MFLYIKFSHRVDFCAENEPCCACFIPHAQLLCMLCVTRTGTSDFCASSKVKVGALLLFPSCADNGCPSKKFYCK